MFGLLNQRMHCVQMVVIIITMHAHVKNKMHPMYVNRRDPLLDTTYIRRVMTYINH